jgi:hypothetical protein
MVGQPLALKSDHAATQQRADAKDRGRLDGNGAFHCA